MTSFARYYKGNNLVNISMTELEILIKDKKNQGIIAEYVYERLYNRFLKIFDYPSDKKRDYKKGSRTETKNIFIEEYKNGFLMMTSCALLIETFASFLHGHNKTPQYKSNDMFNEVFEKAEEYNNALKIFKNATFYKNIRCGLLHQGETYGKFKISRKGELWENNTINAQKFFVSLKELLISYKNELINSDWHSDEWITCRAKIQYIINNAK